MSAAAAAAADDHGGHEHHEESFAAKYLFSTDHKMISRQFLFTSIVMFFLGGALAVAVRWQIAWPFTEIPIFGVFSPENYYAAVTMHASVMIFLVIIPLLLGFFGNWCIPLMIGAEDMAFPRLNMWSFWMFWPGAIFMLAGFFVDLGPNQAGWTSYPPLSAIQPGNGVTLWALGVLFTGFSGVMGAVNYITTILKLRTPGMTLFRMPLVVWSIFITSILTTPRDAGSRIEHHHALPRPRRRHELLRAGGPGEGGCRSTRDLERHRWRPSSTRPTPAVVRC